MRKCQSFNDPEKCRAGLNFAKAYLYQRTARKEEDITRINYRDTAAFYYKKVLEIYPNSKSALTNLEKLDAERGALSSTVERLEDLANTYPSKRTDYLIKIGDLYKKNKNLSKSCQYYSRAYSEDPFSKKACGALVDLYVRKDFICDSGNSIRKFAFNCQEIDAPNYAEKLLRKELSLALKEKAYRKANESLILWANVLANNGWMDPAQVDRFRLALFPKGSRSEPMAKRIEEAMKELKTIFEAERPRSIAQPKFWINKRPSLIVSNEEIEIGPLYVLLRLYKKKGETAYFKSDFKTSEAHWNRALSLSKNYDRAFFTEVASDLAEMYDLYPKMDPDKAKLNKLIVFLFEGKGQSYGRKSLGNEYSEKDLRMIRRYHITLGTIFYKDKSKWDGRGARNARFQLEHVFNPMMGRVDHHFDPRFGETVKPKLRTMLATIYEKSERDNDAINTYFKAIQDYLGLDQMTSAADLYKKLKERLVSKMTAKQRKSFNHYGELIELRNRMRDKQHPLITDQIDISKFIDDFSDVQNLMYKHIPKEVVQVQFFKAYSDLASNVDDSKKLEKQILSVNALTNIQTLNYLPSPMDFNKISKIKRTLEESIEQPDRLGNTKMYNKTNTTYELTTKQSGAKSYTTSSLNKVINIPEKLFQINNTLQKHYDEVTPANKEIARFETKNGEFKLKELKAVTMQDKKQ
ncbi:tetratricopeptide repeat protein [Flavivirga spongiicola]|uniref:Tetratricopeptide repeat protein n=1 Tax=Flavivirga spongiicola TaxID=421621 RepID=A0ABU7XMF0_9FLAO|nr:hypothetical protein [Flavivirga sp. MEBiC05379]MDO5981598.1 hypothetical protein [Flavivirga sp. MEBiC05379]